MVRTSSTRTTIRSFNKTPGAVSVQKHEVTSRVGQKRREPERAPHVAAPGGGVEPRLRGGGTRPPERTKHRSVQPPSEVVCLVEASAHAPPGVKRYRHDPIGADQDIRPGRAHHRRQRPGEYTPAFVFERVEDRSQRALVCAGRARGVNSALGAAAAGTLLEGDTDDAPRRERVATGPTERGGQDPHLPPACAADGAGERRVQHARACRAARGDDHRQQGV